MLDVLHVSKSINNKLVISDCTFQTKENAIMGIVGVNGVGKTTLLRLCSGILKPDNGTILLGTETIYQNVEAKKDIVFISDTPYYEPDSTITSVKAFYEAFYKIDENYFNYLLDIFKLDKRDRLFHLSKGKLKRFYLVLALAIAPKLLLLDETFDGVDPICKKLFKAELKKLVSKNKDTSVVLTSHSLRELSDIADQIGYLDNGVLITLNDKSYLKDPIYQVIVFKEPKENYNLDALYILKKTETPNILIIDCYNDLEKIHYVFKKSKFLEIKEVSFDNWIVYQMEVLR